MAEAEKRESDGILERLFHLREKGTTPRQEMLAGPTTFVAVSYIIFVNPHMLADAGMPQEAAIASTILATVFATAIMGLWANFPVAVAPGMGLNAFFAYYVCTTVGLHWTVALGAVFISGVVFFLLTVTKIRQMLIDAVPLALKSAIVVGIGMFIAFIGMKNAGIVVADKATFVTLGHMLKPEPLLTCFGLILTAVLMAHNVKGAMIIDIFCTTLAAMAVGVAPVPHGIENIVSLSIPDIRPVFFALDIRGAIDYGIVSIVLTFTIVELFDNMGTLIGLSRKAGLMRDDGHIENIDRALLTDSVGTMASSLFGTSTVTSYVESAAGIAQGGRTGLTAVTVAVLFAVSLIFSPLVSLVPPCATAPALIIVGALMMSDVARINFNDFTDAVPAFLTIIMMPLTYSIASGFGFGFVSYAFIKLFTGRGKEVSPFMWCITLLFLANFAMRG